MTVDHDHAMDICSSEEDVLSRMECLKLSECPTEPNLPIQPLNPPKPTQIVAKPTQINSTSSNPTQSVESIQKLALFPYLLSGYVNLAFSILIAAFWIYLLHSFVSAIHSDIDRKVSLFSEEILDQIARCSRDYRENRCDPSTRVPAAAAACVAWEQCMARDPSIVAAHTKLTAETIGESLNAFFEALTWKTIACLFLLSLGLILSYNFAGIVARDGARQASVVRRGRSGDRDSLRSLSSSRR